jgi:radical SAM protein with 4Fe4S-binding SPASM domain
MTTISLNIDRHLARTCKVTSWLKSKMAKPRFLGKVMDGVDYFARGVFYVWRNRQYLSARKLANMALINVQFKMKSERVLGRPYRMKIESTNICNTKCQLCPTGIGLEGRPKGKMSFDQYKQIIDRVHKWLFTLDLSMWGDPMIVPDIYKMIRHAHDKGIWTYISSNLHAYKPDKGHGEALVESGLDMLTCSLHGASQETFEQYQPGKSFHDAIDKVRHIVDVKKKMNSATPTIQLNFVVTRHNEHEIPAFKRLSEELGCHAVFSTAALNTRFLGKNKQLVDLGLSKELLKQKVTDHIKEWLPKDKQYVLGAYESMLNSDFDEESFNGKKTYNCHWPWQNSVINWDGEVVTCCGSFDTSDDMGNVLETDFADIWNGEKYRLARRSFKKKLTQEQAADNPCATCPGFMV